MGWGGGGGKKGKKKKNSNGRQYATVPDGKYSSNNGYVLSNRDPVLHSSNNRSVLLSRDPLLFNNGFGTVLTGLRCSYRAFTVHMIHYCSCNVFRERVLYWVQCCERAR